jgi:hypothetical protein
MSSYSHDWLPRRTTSALSWSWSVELIVVRLLARAIVADVVAMARTVLR